MISHPPEKKLNSHLDETHLKILSLNIANLLTKLSSLKILIHNISNESNMPSIIALTETHLSESRRHGFSENELNRSPHLPSLRSRTNRPENLRLPAYQPNRKMRSFQASTLELWNELPLELQNSSTTNTFKNSLKTTLIAKYECRINCSNPRCNDNRYHQP